MQTALPASTEAQTDIGVKQPETNKSVAAGQKHIKSLTGLRIFPAVAIVLIHSGEHFPALTNASGAFAVTQLMTFFFVLSGFILTLNYPSIRDWKATFSFYFARFARVWPAHASCLLLLIFLIPETFRVTSTTLPMFLANISLAHAWIPSWKYFFSFNAPSWSNSTDMFFYLCFPLLLLGLRKWKWFWVAAITFAFLVGMTVFCNMQKLPEFHATELSNQALMYINPFARILEFTIGMITALFFGRFVSNLKINTITATTLEVSTIALIFTLNLASPSIRLAALPYIGEAGAYWLYNSGVPVFAIAALFMILATEKGLCSRALSLPWLVVLGEMSFALYMLHSVLLAYHGINFPIANSVPHLLMFLATLFVASHLLWMLVEKPMRKLLLTVSSKWLKLDPSQKKDAISSKQKKSPAAIAWVLAEGALLIGLAYFTLPGIQRISEAEATTVASTAGTRNVQFDKLLQLHSGTAIPSPDSLKVDLVWRAPQSGFVNFFVVATVLDKAGQPIAHTTYMQDLRRTHVATGDFWRELFSVPLPKGTNAKEVSIKILKSKRKVLLPVSENGQLQKAETVFVPVTAQ